jgi:hypothetical protein
VLAQEALDGPPVVLDQLPLTAMEKLDRRELRRLTETAASGAIERLWERGGT